MKRWKWSPMLTLALAWTSVAPLAARQPAAPQSEPDWVALAGLYPAPGSPTGQGEQAVLLWLQGARTSQDVQRAISERTPSLGCFAQDIHLGMTASGASAPIDIHDFPKTEAVLAQARADVMPILESLQTLFARPRPYLLYSTLQPALPLPSGPSYPSTNAVLGVVFAQIIGQWDKADLQALRNTGGLLGTDRVLGGVHYPSDVQAGQRLGKAFASWWIDNHLALIQTACPEWTAAR